METLEYGRALYYPHILFESRAWMRTAALYHDNLARIVPSAGPFRMDDLTDEEQRIRDEAWILEGKGIISSEYPDQKMTAAVANTFFDFASTLLANPERRALLFPALAKGGEPYRIYREKIAPTLVDVLGDLGLATREDDYIVCEPVTGAMYMLFLARYMAKNRPIVTDNAVYQALLYTPLENEPGPAPIDKGLMLASAVFKSAVPLNIERVPIEDLIKFREDHTKERNGFYNAISQMASDLGKIEDAKELQGAIDHHTDTFDRNMESLRTKLKLINVTCGAGIFALSLPATLTANWGLGLTNPFVLIGSGALVITGILVKSALERRITSTENGIGYIHSMEAELGPRQYAERFVELNLAGRSSQLTRRSVRGSVRRFMRTSSATEPSLTVGLLPRAFALKCYQSRLGSSRAPI